MAESKKSNTKQVMDVARPGKSAPSPTTKPVIVTNRPVLQDPMVVKDESADESPETTTAATPKRSSGIVIQPLSASKITVTDDSDNNKETEPAKEDDKKDGLLMPSIADSIPDEEPAEEPAKASEPEPKSEPDTKPVKDPVPDDKLADAEPEPETDKASETASKPEAETPEKPTDDKKEHVTAGSVASRGTAVPTTDGALLNEDEAEREEDEHDVMIQKLVDAKTYYLPVNGVEKRRTKRVIVAGVVLCLVLAVAWADIALDAGLINVSGIKPVTHFFSK